MANDLNSAAKRGREARLRRAAAVMGLTLRKSRARDPDRMDFGCYRVETKDGRPVAGTYPYPFSLSLQGAEEALELLRDSPPETAGTRDAVFVREGAGAADSKFRR